MIINLFNSPAMKLFYLLLDILVDLFLIYVFGSYLLSIFF